MYAFNTPVEPIGVLVALTAQPATPVYWPALILALLIVAGGVGYLVFRRLRRRQVWRFAEENAPSSALGRETRNPPAYLVAMESYTRLPAQIDLQRDRPVRMGRNRRECDVLLDDIGISRSHATISYRKGRFYLRDNGSKGGTFLYRAHAVSSPLPDENPETRKPPRLSKSEERSLREGDTIQFYAYRYRFHLENEVTESPDEHRTSTNVELNSSYENGSAV